MMYIYIRNCLNITGRINLFYAWTGLCFPIFVSWASLIYIANEFLGLERAIVWHPSVATSCNSSNSNGASSAFFLQIILIQLGTRVYITEVGLWHEHIFCWNVSIFVDLGYYWYFMLSMFKFLLKWNNI